MREGILVTLIMFNILVLGFTYLLLSGIKDKLVSAYCKRCKGFSAIDKNGKCKVCKEVLEIDNNKQLSVFGYNELKRKDGNVSVTKCIIAASCYIGVLAIITLITVEYIVCAY